MIKMIEIYLHYVVVSNLQDSKNESKILENSILYMFLYIIILFLVYLQ